MTGRQIFRVAKSPLLIISKILSVVPSFILRFVWHLIFPFNGYLSKMVRYVILKAKAKKMGDNVSIGCNTIIKHWDSFSCGDDVSIHEYCMIDCNGGIIIGDQVSIAHSTSLISANHTWLDQNIPIKYNPITTSGIVIESDVWVGAGVRILDGVVIKHRSVVAAGAVVSKSVEANSLVGGVPAKLIKRI